MPKWGPIRVETVRGEPLAIGEKEITPIARVFSFMRRSGTIKKGVSGGGGSFVLIKPVAVLETTSRGTRRIPVHDLTAITLIGLLIAGLALPLLFWLVNRHILDK